MPPKRKITDWYRSKKRLVRRNPDKKQRNENGETNIYASETSHNKRPKTIPISFRFHGNYGGPGWSAGRYQDSVVSTVPATDALDEAYKQHDAAYATAKGQNDLQMADEILANNAYAHGLKGKATYAAMKIQKFFRQHAFSLKNSSEATSAAMAENSTSGNGTDAKNALGQETQVQRTVAVYRNIPEVQTVSLPYIELLPDMDYGLTAGEAVHEYRMNSIFDVVANYDYLDVNSGAGIKKVAAKATDGVSRRNPQYLGLYRNLYKYYTVLGARYHITIENRSTAPLFVYWMYRGNTDPPIGVPNELLQTWPDVSWKYLNGIITPIVTNTAGDDQGEALNTETEGQTSTRIADGSWGDSASSTVCHITGEYTPGEFDREIRNDTDAKIWTLMTANPSLVENLQLRIKPWRDSSTGSMNSSAHGGMAFKYRMRVDIEYLVQFHDLVTDLRYPAQEPYLTVSKTAYTSAGTQTQSNERDPDVPMA